MPVNWSLSTILVHSALHPDVASTPPIVRIILSASPLLAAFGAGHYKAGLACKAASAAAAIRNQQLDLDIAHRAVEAESTLIKSIEDKASAREKRDGDYIATLEARPVCALDARDLDGLSNHESGTSKAKPAGRAK